MTRRLVARVGRSSSSACRARSSTKSGNEPTASTCSRKLTIPSSACCASSITSTTGLSSPTLRRKVVQALKRSSRLNVPTAPIPSSARSGGRATPARRGHRRRCRDPARAARPGRGRRPRALRRRRAGSAAGRGWPRPGRRTRHPRRRTGIGHGASARWPGGRRCTSRTPSPVGSCRRPARRRRRAAPGGPVSSTPWKISFTSRSSRSRPMCGASRPSARWTPPIPATTARADQSGTGSALPFMRVAAHVDVRDRGCGEQSRGLVDPDLTGASRRTGPGRPC